MLNKRRCAFLTGMVLTVAFVFGACSSSPAAPPDASGEAPSQNAPSGSNQVTVYTAFVEDEARALLEKFQDETGIQVKMVRLSSGELFARVQAESNNPQASCWYGTAADTMTVASQSGYLEPYVSTNIGAVPEYLRDPNEVWTPFSLSMVGMLSNNAWFKEHDMTPPTTWEEMLNPAFEGQVVMAHPATSGMAYAWLSTVVMRFGEEDAFKYLNDLNSNIFQYTKGGSAPPRMVGLGEAAVAFTFTHDAYQTINSGYDVSFTVPDGTGYELAALALIKGGPEAETENAKKLIDWSLTVNAQQFWVDEFFRMPIIEGAVTPDYLGDLSGTDLLELDIAYTSDNRERWINRFETEVRGQENLA